MTSLVCLLRVGDEAFMRSSHPVARTSSILPGRGIFFVVFKQSPGEVKLVGVVKVMTAAGDANVGRWSAITGELRPVFKSINKTQLHKRLVVKPITDYKRLVHQNA